MKAGDVVLRQMQHYLAGALNEDAGDFCVLAVARAMELGATTHADAFGMIFQAFVREKGMPREA